MTDYRSFSTFQRPWKMMLAGEGRRPPPDVIEFAEDSRYCGERLWLEERTILKVIYGLELDREEADLIRSWQTRVESVYGLRVRGKVHLPKTKGVRVNEAVLCMGMGSFKSWLAGRIVATYEAFLYTRLHDPWRKFGVSKRSPAFIIFSAKAEEQAKDTSFTHFLASLPRIEHFRYLDDLDLIQPSFKRKRTFDNTARVRFLSHDLSAISIGGDSGSAAGKRALLVIWEELARQYDTEGRLGGKMLYQTLSKALGQPYNGWGLIPSSPQYEGDMVMKRLDAASRLDRACAFQLPTPWASPKESWTSFKIQSAFDDDPEGAMRDIAAMPSHARQPFYKDEDLLLKAFDHANALADGCIPSGEYEGAAVLAIDPGVTNHAFGIAVGRLVDNKPVADGVMQIKPGRHKEVQENDVKKVLAAILKRWTVIRFIFDQWHFAGLIQWLEKEKGIERVHRYLSLQVASRAKSMIYEKDESRRASLPDDVELRRQMVSLELVEGKYVMCRRDIEKNDNLPGDDESDPVQQVLFELDIIRGQGGPDDDTWLPFFAG